jgi:hypothetical protein
MFIAKPLPLVKDLPNPPITRYSQDTSSVHNKFLKSQFSTTTYTAYAVSMH